MVIIRRWGSGGISRCRPGSAWCRQGSAGISRGQRKSTRSGSEGGSGTCGPARPLLWPVSDWYAPRLLCRIWCAGGARRRLRRESPDYRDRDAGRGRRHRQHLWRFSDTAGLFCDQQDPDPAHICMHVSRPMRQKLEHK